MSGPWDRPSSDGPDEPWPSEDLDGRRSPGFEADTGAAGASSASDSGRQASADAAPGWDDWPPAPPPPDDYLIEDPLPPSSDPWAESWTDEAVEDAPVTPRRDDFWSAPPPADRWAAEPERDVGTPEPRIEPWSPDPDPWELHDALAEPVPDRSDVEPERLPAPPQPPIDVAPTPSEPPVDAETEPAADLPDWLADPLPAAAVEPESDADADGGPADADAVPDAASESEPEAASTSLPPAEAEPAQEPGPAAEPAPGSRPSWRSAIPWFGGGRREGREDAADGPDQSATPAEAPAPPDADLAGERGASTVDEEDAAAIAAREAGGEDPGPDRFVPIPSTLVEQPWTAAADAQDAEARDGADAVADGHTADADADGAVPGVAAADAPDVEVGAPPSGPPAWEPDARPGSAELGDRAGAAGGDEPRPPDPWGDSEWPERGESTQVLPTSWAPTPPGPVRETPGELEPTAGTVRTGLVEADPDLDDDPALAPSTAEQAVPWLIGVILLLAGMVIVLLALIFAGDASLAGPAATPNPTLMAVAPTERPTATSEAARTRMPSPSPTVAPVAPVATVDATPTLTPAPQYGPLEMIYQGRSAALAPIYLLLHDFTVEEEPSVLAQDASVDVRRFAWAPDGRVGVGLLADVLVSIEPGTEKRRLGDSLSAITFGDDATTVYAVRVTEDGADDVAAVLAIDFASGDTEELASISVPRPAVGERSALAEAQFNDEGGAIRLFWMLDDTLRLWADGAGAWEIDPGDGEVTPLEEGAPPLLWSRHPQRIVVEESEGTTTLTLTDERDRDLAETTIEGRVSHVRWAPTGDRVVFTVGRSASGGGVLQNLFLWDLEDGEEPMQLTATGAAFGAEWRGAQPRWRD